MGEIPGLSHGETETLLIAALADAHSHVRGEAIRSLAWRHKWAPDLIPLFLGLLRDPDYQVRRAAATEIGNAVPRGGEGRDRAVPALLPLLDDPVTIVRQNAVEAIGTIANRCGRAADPLMADLRRKLADPVPEIRVDAARAMAWSGAGDEAAPLLEAYVLAHVDDRPDASAGRIDTAFNALARIADRSDEVVSFLLARVHRPGGRERDQFFDALTYTSSVGGEGRRRVERLCLEALKSGDADLAVGAATVLTAIGRSVEAAPGWIEILRRHDDPGVRRKAVNALENLRFQGTHPEAVAALRRAMNDPDEEVRASAARGVAMFEKTQARSTTSP